MYFYFIYIKHVFYSIFTGGGGDVNSFEYPEMRYINVTNYSF